MCLVVAIGINMSGVGKYSFEFCFLFFVELSFRPQLCMEKPSLFLRTSRSAFIP